MSSDIKNVSADVQQRIRDLAYLMWESAGRQQNMALQYWLNAEREVFSSIQAATEVMMSPLTQPQMPTERLAESKPADPGEPLPKDAGGASAQGKEAAAASSATEPAPAAANIPQPVESKKNVPAKTASEPPAGKPAPRRTGSRKKTTG